VAENKQWHIDAAERGFASVVGLPLIDKTQTFGALVIFSTKADVFEQEEIDMLQELANDLAYGITALHMKQEREQADRQISYQSFHDKLTGLPNRPMVIHALENSIEKIRHEKGAAAILFINFDDFKLVNNTYGHAFGDELLVQAADRLTRIVRDRDIVARQGADEFIVLLERFKTHEADEAGKIDSEAAIIAQRILEDMRIPFQIIGQDAYVSASIGISLYPGDAVDPIQLIQQADSAMYRAKELGRGNYQFYSRKMTERQQKRMSLATLLHQGIEQQEFLLYYQPIIDMNTGKMMGVEALIRWEHEKGHLISPLDFLPIAEDTGMILPIGEWVLREACRQIKIWGEKGIVLNTAINISARQMWQGDIASMVLDVIRETGVPKELVELEITESAMIIDHERMEATLEKFRGSGLKIALDDFGTGYSSLDRLKHLPFHKLKIDKSFIDDLPDDKDNLAIVTATVQMARSLELCSLAEGIETIEQYRCLKNLGCEFGQGYYFSRPVLPLEIERLYAQNHHWEG